MSAAAVVLTAVVFFVRGKVCVSRSAKGARLAVVCASCVAVFNCDTNVLPKATTDLETTLWEGKQFCIGWTSQMLSGSRVVACYRLAIQQVSVV